MVKEIRIYAEGGGDDSQTRSLIRKGFSGFLKKLIAKAREKRIRWQIIACGSRNDAFSNFMNALEDHPNAFNVLLVDSEDQVDTTPWEHLQNRDGWDSQGINDEHCHLMVQMMESWFIADINTLKQFYGQGFQENSLPRNQKVEEINKRDLETALKRATERTSKGVYHKTRHGPKLLEQLDADKVRSIAPYCDRLFTTLAEKMGVSI